MIAAEGEHKASSALKEAAHVIEDSPHALQVIFIASKYHFQEILLLFKTILVFGSDFELFSCHFNDQAEHTNQ